LRHRPLVAARRKDVHVRRRGAGGDGLEDRSGVRPMASSGATVIDETLGGGIMTPTHVDQLTETPPLEPEIVTLPPAPSAPRRSRVPSAWAPMFETRERRWCTAALAATLLLSAGGLGLLSLHDTA